MRILTAVAAAVVVFGSVSVLVEVVPPRPSRAAYFQAALPPLYDTHERLTLLVLDNLHVPDEPITAAGTALRQASDHVTGLAVPSELHQLHQGLTLALGAAQRNFLASEQAVPDVAMARERVGGVIQAVRFARDSEQRAP